MHPEMLTVWFCLFPCLRRHTHTQIKAFTQWWRLKLARLGVTIDDLCAEIPSGVLPCRLMEALTSKPVKHNAVPKNRYQNIENHTAFLSAVAADGVKLLNIGPEDLLEGNPKLICGLTWQLIRKYEIGQSNEPGKSSSDELLAWVRL